MSCHTVHVNPVKFKAVKLGLQDLYLIHDKNYQPGDTIIITELDEGDVFGMEIDAKVTNVQKLYKGNDFVVVGFEVY